MGFEVGLGGVRVGSRVQRRMESVVRRLDVLRWVLLRCRFNGSARRHQRALGRHVHVIGDRSGGCGSLRCISRLLAIPHLQTSHRVRLRRYRSGIVRPEYRAAGSEVACVPWNRHSVLVGFGHMLHVWRRSNRDGVENAHFLLCFPDGNVRHLLLSTREGVTEMATHHWRGGESPRNPHSICESQR